MYIYLKVCHMTSYRGIKKRLTSPLLSMKIRHVHQSKYLPMVSFTFYFVPVVQTHYDQEKLVRKQSLVVAPFPLLLQVQCFFLHGSLKQSYQIV